MPELVNGLVLLSSTEEPGRESYLLLTAVGKEGGEHVTPFPADGQLIDLIEDKSTHTTYPKKQNNTFATNVRYSTLEHLRTAINVTELSRISLHLFQPAWLIR